MKELIIFLGPPASGKGTQSALIAQKYNYLSISTGDLLRKEKASGSDLGKEIAKIIDAGNLVSDDLVFKLLKNQFETADCNGFILDGYPRTIEQAKMLDVYLSNSKDLILKKVFVIDLDKQSILDRICNRLTCKKCGAIFNLSTKKPKKDGICDFCGSTDLISRNDDINIDSVNNRIDIFKANITNISSFYQKKSLIFLIDGLNSIESINRKIVDILGVLN